MPMKPTNTRQRRGQFFSFLLLFLLAVVPIVTVVYLYGRVDHVENAYLRSHYQSQQATGAFSAARGKLISDLLEQLEAVNNTVADERMADGKMGASMSNQLKALEDRAGALKDDLAIVPDSLVRKLLHTVELYYLTGTRYNELYSAASQQLQKERTDAATLGKSRDDWKVAAEKCMKRLPKDEQELIVTPN